MLEIRRGTKEDIAQVAAIYDHILTLEDRAAEYDGKLMLDGEYDWGEPVGREVW